MPPKTSFKRVIKLRLHNDFDTFVCRVGVRCMYPSIAWSEHGPQDDSIERHKDYVRGKPPNICGFREENGKKNRQSFNNCPPPPPPP